MLLKKTRVFSPINYEFLTVAEAFGIDILLKQFGVGCSATCLLQP